MIFDGLKFRRNRNIVAAVLLQSIYVSFFRVHNLDQAEKRADQVEVPGYNWPDGSPVYGEPIVPQAYSLTNMAYGNDGRVYLAKDGHCYTALLKKNKS